MENLLLFLTLTITAFFQVNVSIAIMLVTSKGHFLSWWLPYIAKFFVNRNDERLEWYVNNEEDELFEAMHKIALSNIFYRILGGCPACMNAWLSVLIFPISCIVFDINYIIPSFIVYLFLVTGIWNSNYVYFE